MESSEMSAPKGLASPERRSVGVLLAIGIFAFPIIFVWFLCRSGHTKTSRAIGFGWLLFFLVWSLYRTTQTDTSEMIRPPLVVPNSATHVVQSGKGLTEAERSLDAAVQIERASLPRTVAEGIRGDSIEVTGPKEITSRFTLLDFKASEVDASVLKSRERMLAVCATLRSVQNGITYVYEYHGNDGALIASLKFDPQTCGPAQ